MSAACPLILALDVGTTSVKVCVFQGPHCALVHQAEEPLSLLVSPDGQLVELDPDQLWEQLIRLSRSAISASSALAGPGPSLLGLSCQRNTFVCWDRRTLRPCHRLVTWKDARAAQYCDRWNGGLRRKLLNLVGWLAHLLTRSERFKAARIFRLMGAMVPPRFLVLLEQNPSLRSLLASGELALGTMDCWLLAKLSAGRVFLSEPSSASSTGMFDPFMGDWGHSILSLLGFPSSVLPPLGETVGLNVPVDSALFGGHQITVTASLGDSQAAAFGSGCLREGDLKISLGTGTLFSVVTGAQPHASLCGMYPLVGWKVKGQSTFLLEGRANDTASAVQWATGLAGLLPHGEPLGNCAQLAASADPDDGSLCFVPAFGGVQSPIDDEFACAALMGIRANTTRPQMLRAVLESIAFGVFQIWECLLAELPRARSSICRIRCCGGVARNEFICQQIASLLGRPLELVAEPQFCSARGAAMLAGIGAGLWGLDQVDQLVSVERIFQPAELAQRGALLARFRRWQLAQRCCLRYYSSS